MLDDIFRPFHIDFAYFFRWFLFTIFVIAFCPYSSVISIFAAAAAAIKISMAAAAYLFSLLRRLVSYLQQASPPDFSAFQRRFLHRR